MHSEVEMPRRRMQHIHGCRPAKSPLQKPLWLLLDDITPDWPQELDKLVVINAVRRYRYSAVGKRTRKYHLQTRPHRSRKSRRCVSGLLKLPPDNRQPRLDYVEAWFAEVPDPGTREYRRPTEFDRMNKSEIK